MATMNPIALTVAFSHLVFNIMGIIILYPFKFIPIRLSIWLANITAKTRKNTIIFLIIYYLLHVIPLIFLIWK